MVVNEFLFNDKPFDIITPEREKGDLTQSEGTPFLSDLLREMGKIRVEIVRMQRKAMSGMIQQPGHQPGQQAQQIEQVVTPLDQSKSEDAIKAMKYLEILVREVKTFKPELANMRKEVRNDLSDEIVKGLFQVIDAFNRVFESMKSMQDDPKNKNWLEGIRQIYNTMLMVLKRHGYMEIDSLGQMFNPKIHAAVGTLKDPSKPNGTIVRVDRIGFIRDGIPMRFPEVIVVKND